MILTCKLEVSRSNPHDILIVCAWETPISYSLDYHLYKKEKEKKNTITD